MSVGTLVEVRVGDVVGSINVDTGFSVGKILGERDDELITHSVWTTLST